MLLLDGENLDTLDLSTRDRPMLMVYALWSDGSQTDITTEAELTISDEEILVGPAGGMLYPVWEGAVTVEATWEGLSDSVEMTITISAATAGDLVFNEVLADGLVEGDPNADGSTDDVEDEFIEIANVSGATLDLSGALLIESDFTTGLPRHTFQSEDEDDPKADGRTIMLTGEAIVVFGGGDVSALSEDNVQFVVANAEDPGLQYGLSLGDDGDHIQLIAADEKTTICELAWGDADPKGVVSGVSDASLTLEPDMSGTTWVDHRKATGSAGDYSPGTFVDGSPFPGDTIP